MRLTQNALNVNQIATWFGTPYVVATNPIVEYLVIAGGGAGGYDRGSGGGAGGYRSSVFGEFSGGGVSASVPLTCVLGTNYSVSIGAGGATVSGYSIFNNGTDSSFSTITSVGGGAGVNQGTPGKNGGSGGGDFSTQNGNSGAGSGTAGQGFAGGFTSNPYHGAGGGGGAGSVGEGGGSGNGNGGAGGIGVASSITGSSIFRAGGGGGGASMDFASPRNGGAGGNGGGGAGGTGGGAAGTQGSSNTGGGGGGGSNISQGNGAAGGSGIVILRYATTFNITLGAGLTGTTTTVGASKVTTITNGTGNVSWTL